mmetsp:Transcript_39260/g.82134  ORF Transcript_39260/g.82134 Transcript_39260/m.82134 type:complete len:122 (+) Transcript_39260:1744-2109(+)
MLSYPSHEFSKVVDGFLDGGLDLVGRREGNARDDKGDPVALGESYGDSPIGGGVEELGATGCHPAAQDERQAVKDPFSVEGPCRGVIVAVVIVVAVGVSHVIQRCCAAPRIASRTMPRWRR